MYITKLAKTPEEKLIAKAMKKAYIDYYKNWNNYGEELFSNALIETYKIKKDIQELSEKERYIKYYKVANNAMSKTIHEIYKNNGILSLNEKIKIKNNDMFREKNTLTFENLIKDDKTKIESGLNYNFILTLFKKEIEKKETKEKNIITEYTILGNKPSEIKKKYKIKSEELERIIKNFREEFFNKLVKYNYFENKDKNQYLKNTDFDGKEKKEQKIKELIKQSQIPISEIAKTLNTTEEDIKKILSLKTRKFFLYEIQKLRTTYFSKYTLEELEQC